MSYRASTCDDQYWGNKAWGPFSNLGQFLRHHSIKVPMGQSKTLLCFPSVQLYFHFTTTPKSIPSKLPAREFSLLTFSLGNMSCSSTCLLFLKFLLHHSLNYVKYVLASLP